MTTLHTNTTLHSWMPNVSDTEKAEAVSALEKGNILFYPQLFFSLETPELRLLTPQSLKPGRKNISYNAATKQLKGHHPEFVDKTCLLSMMQRFHDQAFSLVVSLFPSYVSQLRIGRTSFRPAEIVGRESSYRKDDMRLHVDAFPATPVHGLRMLRVFSNINPNGKPRVWRTGEPFENVMKRFIPSIYPPIPFSRELLFFFNMTKKKRTLYDHYMLRMHDAMKKDMNYQKTVSQETISLPAQTSWIVFTDQVSHAAMSGQYLLEQTFYLPPDAQQYPHLSPLKQLEAFLEKPLLV